MKLKRLGSLGSALVLSFSALLSVTFAGTAFAAAPYTCTWTGATNNNFNTAGNWTGCNSAAPQPGDGDNLVFDTTSLSASQTLTNDITGLTVGSMTFSGSNTSYGFTVTGNALTITGGITQSSFMYTDLNLDVTLGASQTFAISNSSNLIIGDQTLSTSHTLALGSNTLTVSDSSTCSGVSVLSALTGSGTLNDNSAWRLVLNSASPSYSGAINVNSGQLQVNNSQSLGTGSSGVTVASGAGIAYGISANTTFAQPLTISGTGMSSSGAIMADGPDTSPSGCSGGGGPVTAYTATLSGNITLLGNTTANPSSSDYNLAVTGGLTGNYTLTVVPGAPGTLTINSSNNTSQTPNGSETAPLQTITLASGDNQPSLTVTVGTNQTYVIDGVRGDTYVENGGTIKGLGTVGNLWVAQGGIVAPGHSPGCLTTSGNLGVGGTYQAEIGGTTACSGYDQLDVTGTVTLDDGNTPPNQGILQLSIVNGFKPTAGQTFEIINNEGSSAVKDTFSGLPEGSEITVSGYVFKISYVGGTGNDVVLTVVSVPKTPDTGFGLINSHVGLPLVGTLMMAGGIYVISRKIKSPATSKKR
ncbi:MAG TPA: hypothetical protein VIH90_08370 [Candidatus Saccharimonadales bacterium]